MSVASRVVVSGPTIHSAGVATVTLARSPGPLTFERDGTYIAATVANVVATDRTTTLGSDGVTVSLVEHLLAALRMAGFHEGVVVSVDGPELPILDGSAAPWLAAVARLGPPPLPPAPLVIEEAFTLDSDGSTATVRPGPERLEYVIDFPHPAIGRQEWRGAPTSYNDLAAARTFGFLAEAEALSRRGLALGAVQEHAIVFNEDGPMSALRFPDEPVRHKALDAVGDLALLGRPIGAAIAIERGSHRLHHALALALLERATGGLPS